MSFTETKFVHCSNTETFFCLVPYMCIVKLLCALLLSGQTHALHKNRSNAAAGALSVQSALCFQVETVPWWRQE